jgi:hypothetical protein
MLCSVVPIGHDDGRRKMSSPEQFPAHFLYSGVIQTLGLRSEWAVVHSGGLIAIHNKTERRGTFDVRFASCSSVFHVEIGL